MHGRPGIFFCITTSLSPICKLACKGDLGDCRTPKGFALRCETEPQSSGSQPTRVKTLSRVLRAGFGSASADKFLSESVRILAEPLTQSEGGGFLRLS